MTNFEKVGLFDLPSIHKIESVSELPDVIKNSLKKSVNVDDLTRYRHYVSLSSFEFRYHTIQHAIEDKVKIGGYNANSEIDSNEMFGILEKFKSELSFVASKFIEKIND